MTRSPARRAVARLGEHAIRTDAGLGVHAPEEAIVRRRHSRVVFDADELLLPAQRGAESFASGVEAFVIGKHHHAAPPGKADPSGAKAPS